MRQIATPPRHDTKPDLRPLEAAIARTLRQRQWAERERDRAAARLYGLDDRLAHLRAERDRLLTGSTGILPAPARLVTDRGLWYWAVICPYCGAEHRDGGSAEPPPAGGRYSHCAPPFATREYLMLVSGEVAE